MKKSESEKRKRRNVKKKGKRINEKIRQNKNENIFFAWRP